MRVQSELFGRLADGREVYRHRVGNPAGYVMEVIDFGAALKSFIAPDRTGTKAEVNLGFDRLADYVDKRYFFGATIGRFANRIAGGSFELDGLRYTLATNNGPNHLHGGVEGFDRRVWEPAPFENADEAGVEFKLESPDGDQGYPGSLRVSVRYSLNSANELRIDYHAESDRPTIVNLTNHSFWNLGGTDSGTILDHELELNCPTYLAVDKSLIPSGEPRPVKGTPFDFTRSKPIGRDIEATGIGYDHCFVVDPAGPEPRIAARLRHPATGRVMEILTDKPAVQFYSGNNMKEGRASGGVVLKKRGSMCLETEFFPDAPNHPEWAQARLDPGREYRYTTRHRFTVD